MSPRGPTNQNVQMNRMYMSPKPQRGVSQQIYKSPQQENMRNQSQFMKENQSGYASYASGMNAQRDSV